MGLFPRFFHRKPDEDVAEAVVAAASLGYDRGFAAGIKSAMESQADAIDQALASADPSPDVRRLLQMMSRSAKECAAEVEEISS